MCKDIKKGTGKNRCLSLSWNSLRGIYRPLRLLVNFDALVLKRDVQHPCIVGILLGVQRLLHQFQVAVDSVAHHLLLVFLRVVGAVHLFGEKLADVGNFLALFAVQVQVLAQLFYADVSIPFLLGCGLVACRIAGRTASRPVCGKYRIAVSLREGFFLLKKKRIAELSMLYYPSEFPVSHRSVISSMGTLCVRT